jgi:hypothetical protein
MQDIVGCNALTGLLEVIDGECKQIVHNFDVAA